jgi:hypothetical protein
MAIARAAIAIGNSDDGAWRRSGEHCERDEAVARGWEASWRELRDDIWTRSVRGVRWLFSAPLQHTQGGRRSPPPPWLRVGLSVPDTLRDRTTHTGQRVDCGLREQ